jgi:predicted RNase H-like HicB family nuclease
MNSASRHDTVFNVNLASDPDGGFVVTCLDLPEVITQGDTRREALDNAADALAEAVARRRSPAACAGATTSQHPPSPTKGLNKFHCRKA